MVEKHQKISVYPAAKYNKLGLWFRRWFLGHFVVDGKQLKKILPKGSVDKRVLKNKVLYGVKIKTIKYHD